jgi:putative transcriptional regulator
MKSLRGHLLVASPHLPDPNFEHTVVLMVQHNDQGALGLVLNRPSDNRLRDVWEEVTNEPCDADQSILVGGPVPGPLMAIHTRMNCSEEEIQPGIYFATQRDNMERLVRENAQPFLVFSGYSGWGEGQLEAELKAGGWLTCPAEYDFVFPPIGDDVWKKVVNQIGSDILSSSLNIDRVPEDPSLN